MAKRIANGEKQRQFSLTRTDKLPRDAKQTMGIMAVAEGKAKKQSGEAETDAAEKKAKVLEKKLADVQGTDVLGARKAPSKGAPSIATSMEVLGAGDGQADPFFQAPPSLRGSDSERSHSDLRDRAAARAVAQSPQNSDHGGPTGA